MQAAIVAAIAARDAAVTASLTYDCATGNCTFNSPASNKYGTLRVCTVCADTSSLIQRTESSYPDYPDIAYNASLPNGMHISFTSIWLETVIDVIGSGDLSWAGDLISPDMLAAAVWAYANVTVLTFAFPNGAPYVTEGNTSAHAATCTLYPCLQSYTANVSSGSLWEQPTGVGRAVPEIGAILDKLPTTYETGSFSSNIIGNISENIFYTHSAKLRAVQSPCLIADTVWTTENMSSAPNAQALTFLDFTSSGQGVVTNTSAPLDCLYDFDYTLFWFMRLYLQSTVFQGNCTYDIDMSIEHVECDGSFWLDSLYNTGNATAASIIAHLEGFGSQMTTQLRMGLAQERQTPAYGSPRNYVQGQAWQMTVCIKVSWAWLLFPLGLCVTTTGLLIWMVTQTWTRRGHEMVWKSSVLPFLLYGDHFVTQNAEDMSSTAVSSNAVDQAEQEPLLDIDELEHEAKQRIVQFR